MQIESEPNGNVFPGCLPVARNACRNQLIENQRKYIRSCQSTHNTPYPALTESERQQRIAEVMNYE